MERFSCPECDRLWLIYSMAFTRSLRNRDADSDMQADSSRTLEIALNAITEHLATHPQLASAQIRISSEQSSQQLKRSAAAGADCSGLLG